MTSNAYIDQLDKVYKEFYEKRDDSMNKDMNKNKEDKSL